MNVNLEIVRTHLEAARNEVKDLACGKRNGGRDFQMSIPARDSDSDFILSAALDDLEALLTTHEDARKIAERLPKSTPPKDLAWLRLDTICVEPGDIVVITISQSMNNPHYLRVLRQILSTALPKGTDLLLVVDGVALSVLSRPAPLHDAPDA